MSSSQPSRFAPYKSALEALSRRTKTPLPSLIVSFAMLHELTAVVPLVSVFFTARALGVGEKAVAFVRNEVTDDSEKGGWVREKGAQWVNEGEQWAARVGRRYGVFGYSKSPKSKESDETSAGGGLVPQNIAGDVANAVFAYGVTKASLPARIGLSMYFAPAYSRGVVEPARALIVRTIWKR